MEIHHELDKASENERLCLTGVIIQMLANKPMTNRQIVSQLGKSEPHVHNTLRRLMKQGIVVRKVMSANPGRREVYVYGLIERNKSNVLRKLRLTRRKKAVESFPRRLGGPPGVFVVDSSLDSRFEPLKRARMQELQAARAS